jgi:hypothetical protein
MIAPFENRAVAYLDVLGFSAAVRKAEVRPDLLVDFVGLVSVIESHARFDNSTLSPALTPQTHPRYLFVSDTLIITTPMGSSQYDGLDALVVKTTQIALKVMRAGHLLRGVINIGSVWHTETNIFGSGYMEAAALEKEVNAPRVLLTSAAQRLWKSPGRLAPNMCLDDSNNTIVDVLNEYYVRQLEPIEGTPVPYYQMLRIRIVDSLRNLAPNTSAWKKWRWMASFFNDALRRHAIDVPSIALPPISEDVNPCLFGRFLRKTFGG